MSALPPSIYQTQVNAEWVDYNGHLRDAFYFLIFSYAVDALMDQIGLNSDNRAATGHSLFTLEAHINYLQEVKQGADVEVRMQLLGHDHKRLHLYLSLHKVGEGKALAVSEQMLLHVDLAGPKATPFAEPVLVKVQGLKAAQGQLPAAEYAGRVMGLPL